MTTPERLTTEQAVTEIESLLDRLPRLAARSAEYADLAGESGNGYLGNIITRLGRTYHAAIRDLNEIRHHEHVWDYGASESSPVRCTICGADGLA